MLVGIEEEQPTLLPKLVQLLSTGRSAESLDDAEMNLLDSWYDLDQTSKLLHLLLSKGTRPKTEKSSFLLFGVIFWFRFSADRT